jgi:hypothetical protein
MKRAGLQQVLLESQCSTLVMRDLLSLHLRILNLFRAPTLRCNDNAVLMMCISVVHELFPLHFDGEDHVASKVGCSVDDIIQFI